MAEFDHVRNFERAAMRHMQDAEKLLLLSSEKVAKPLDHLRHLPGAVYLSGYAIECVLKQFLILMEPPSLYLEDAIAVKRKRGEAVPDLVGASGHDLNLLLNLTRLAIRLEKLPLLKRDWGICNKWKSSLRYDIRKISDAETRVNASQSVYNWVREEIEKR